VDPPERRQALSSLPEARDVVTTLKDYGLGLDTKGLLAYKLLNTASRPGAVETAVTEPV
jgi:hypothetical protein